MRMRTGFFYFFILSVFFPNYSLAMSRRWFANIIISDQTTYSSSTYDFGEVEVGNSAEKSFTLINTGNLTTLIIEGNLHGSNDLSFKGGSYPGEGGTCKKFLKPRRTCTIIVEFHPSSAEIKKGNIKIRYHGLNRFRVATKELRGTGKEPNFYVGEGFDGEVLTIVRTQDNSRDIYVGGLFKKYQEMDSPKIIRLNSDGSVDKRFKVGTGFDGMVRTILPLKDGSGDVYVGGTFRLYNNTERVSIVRLNFDGSLDNQFNARILSGSMSWISSIIPADDSSGDIIIGGNLNINRRQHPVIRLKSNGSLSTQFNYDNGLGGVVSAMSPAENTNGSIYISGKLRYQVKRIRRVIRLNSEGNLDETFQSPIPGVNQQYCQMLPLMDDSGNLYISGDFRHPETGEYQPVLRIYPDGSIDRSFHFNGAANGTVSSMALSMDADHSLYIGYHYIADNVRNVHAYRLDYSGKIVDGLTDGVGFEFGALNVIEPSDLTNDSIYVGGSFTRYYGQPANRIMRLDSYPQ